MSLINKMLQDLDQRNAPQAGIAGASAGGQSAKLAQQVRPVRSRRFVSDFFWPVMSVLMLTAVGWVAWVAWQIMPHSVVTELAFESKQRKTEAPKAAPVLAGAQPAPAPTARPVDTGPAKFDMLRLATDRRRRSQNIARAPLLRSPRREKAARRAVRRVRHLNCSRGERPRSPEESIDVRIPRRTSAPMANFDAA